MIFYLVSVIIPAYNAEAFIAQTLESVIQQDYPNFEIVVVDDGSCDRTVDIIQTIAAQNSHIRLIQQTNQGVAAARNAGIRAAQGQFIAPIDADDIWFPSYLSQLMQQMEDPSVGMVYAWSVLINETGQLTKDCQTGLWEGDQYSQLMYRNVPGNASSVLMRRSCLDQVGWYDTSYLAMNAQGCEDWDLYLRLTERYSVRVVPEILVGYRQVRNSMSSQENSMLRGMKIILDRLASRHPNINPALYRWTLSNFNWYLAEKSGFRGDHKTALGYMLASLQLDYFPLLRLGFYRLAIASGLKYLFSPLTSLIWPTHAAWVHFKETVFFPLRQLNPFIHPIDIAALQQRHNRLIRRFPHKQLRQLIDWRCHIYARTVDYSDYSSSELLEDGA